MIRKLIIIALAIIGIAALVYFGIDWIESGFNSLKDKAIQGYEEIKDLPQKINDITNTVKPSQ